MTHIGTDIPNAPGMPSRTTRSASAPPISPLWAPQELAGLAHAEPAADVAALEAAGIAPLPPPAPPQVPVDARVLQAMASFEAEIQDVCVHLGRFAAAQDRVNADLVRQSHAAVSGSFCSDIDHITDGGMHYFMRLRMQDAHSGAAELRRLSMGAIRAQDRHLEAQQEHAKTAQAAAEKMKPLLARAHMASMAAHTFSLAAGCAVGIAWGVGMMGAAAPVSAVGVAYLSLGLAWGAVVGGSFWLGGDAERGFGHAATALDIGAMAGLLMMNATLADPWIGTIFVVSRLVDGLASTGTQMLQTHQQNNVREAQALAQMARELGALHERGYVSCTDVVQRLSQSHARTLGIINAMLRSSQQVNNLQIRNLRK